MPWLGCALAGSANSELQGASTSNCRGKREPTTVNYRGFPI